MDNNLREVSFHQGYNYADFGSIQSSTIHEQSGNFDDTEFNESTDSFCNARIDVNVMENSKILKNSIELKSEHDGNNLQPLQPPRRRSSLEIVAFDDLDLPPRFPQRHSIRNSMMKSHLSSLIYSLNLESLDNTSNVDDESNAQNSFAQYDQTPRTSNVLPTVVEVQYLINDIIAEDFAMDENSERKLLEDRSGRSQSSRTRKSSDIRKSRYSMEMRPPVQPHRRSTISVRKPSVLLCNDVSFATFLSSITFDASHPFEVSRLDFDIEDVEQSRRSYHQKKLVMIRSQGFGNFPSGSLNESHAPVPPRRRSSSQSTLPR